MPEPQPHPTLAAPALAPAALVAHDLAEEDLDYALGCECADPSLQIERWTQERAAATGGR